MFSGDPRGELDAVRLHPRPCFKNTSLGGITMTQKPLPCPQESRQQTGKLGRWTGGRHVRGQPTTGLSGGTSANQVGYSKSSMPVCKEGRDGRTGSRVTQVPHCQGRGAAKELVPSLSPNTKHFCRQYFLYTVVDGTAPGSAFSFWVKTLNPWGLPFSWVLANMSSGTVILGNLVYGA